METSIDRRLHQGQDAAVAEAQPRGSLALDNDGVAHRVEVVFADQAVVAERFDVQQRRLAANPPANSPSWSIAP